MGRRTLGLMTAALVTAGCGAAEAELIPAATLPAVEIDLDDSNNVDPVETSTSITTSTTLGSVVVERFLEEDPGDATTTTSAAPCVGICGPATVGEQAVRIGNQTQVGTTIAPPPTTIDSPPGDGPIDDPNCRRVPIYDDDGNFIGAIEVCD